MKKMETVSEIKEGKIQVEAIYKVYLNLYQGDASVAISAAHSDIRLCLFAFIRGCGLPDSLKANGLEIVRLLDWLKTNVTYGAIVDAEAYLARWRALVEALELGAEPIKLPLLARKTALIQREVMASLQDRDRTLASVEYALAQAAGKPLSETPIEHWSIDLILKIPDAQAGLRTQLLRTYGARQEIDAEMDRLFKEIEVLAKMH